MIRGWLERQCFYELLRPNIIIEKFLSGAIYFNPRQSIVRNFVAVCRISGDLSVSDLKVINILNTWSSDNNISNVDKVKELNTGSAEEVIKDDLW